MYKYLKEMMIDEERAHVLTRYGTKDGNKYIESDHNILVGKFNVSFKNQPKTVRRDIFK